MRSILFIMWALTPPAWFFWLDWQMPGREVPVLSGMLGLAVWWIVTALGIHRAFLRNCHYGLDENAAAGKALP